MCWALGRREKAHTPELGTPGFPSLLSEDPSSASSPSQLSEPLLLSEPQFPYVHHGPRAPSLSLSVLQRRQGTSGHPGASPGLASLRYLSAGSSVILECCQFGKSEINVLPAAVCAGPGGWAGWWCLTSVSRASPCVRGRLDKRDFVGVAISDLPSPCQVKELYIS